MRLIYLCFAFLIVSLLAFTQNESEAKTITVRNEIHSGLLLRFGKTIWPVLKRNQEVSMQNAVDNGLLTATHFTVIK